MLTSGPHKEVAKRLAELIEPFGSIGENDCWMPDGFEALDEAQLDKSPDLVPDSSKREILRDWWLALAHSRSRTPNWDIASRCTIDGKTGLLLVEAKAHIDELKADDRCDAGMKNLERIGEAIREANHALSQIRPGWNLSYQDHYQLSNRFVWSWKLASLGMPVVLVYLGFLGAGEMPDPLTDAQSWERAVRDYARHVVPGDVWGDKILIGEIPIYPLIRSMGTPLGTAYVRT